jgi:Zinc finger, C3HC4 type (RING finger)
MRSTKNINLSQFFFLEKVKSHFLSSFIMASSIVSSSEELQCSCGVKVTYLKDLLQHRKTCEHRVCCICLDRMAATIIEPCLHNLFCVACLNTVLTTSTRCPVCRSAVHRAHGEGVKFINSALDKAALCAIANFIITTPDRANEVLEWERFLAAIRGESTQIFVEAQVIINGSWAQVVERAQQLLAENPIVIGDSDEDGDNGDAVVDLMEVAMEFIEEDEIIVID